MTDPKSHLSPKERILAAIDELEALNRVHIAKERVRTKKQRGWVILEMAFAAKNNLALGLLPRETKPFLKLIARARAWRSAREDALDYKQRFGHVPFYLDSTLHDAENALWRALRELEEFE